MLSFYNPAMLWGLSFLAVPVILHFLNRQRLTRLDISSTRFFKHDAVRASRRRTLQRIVLLITRLLLITLLVLIFAKPYTVSNPLNAIWSPEAGIYVWIDRSMSMSYVEQSTSLKDKSLQLCDSLRKYVSASARVLLWDSRKAEFAEFDKEEAATFRPQHGPGQFARMSAAFLAAAKDNPGPRLLLAFSDFQLKPDSAPPSPVAELLDPTRTVPEAPPVVLVPLRPERPWNYALRGAQSSSENPTILTASFTAQGRDAQNIPCNVVSGSLVTGGKSITTSADSIVEVSISLPENSPASSGAIEIESNDPLRFDDRDYWVAGRKKSHSVLVIGDAMRSFSLTSAFLALGSDAWHPVVAKTIEEASLEDVERADIIVLNETGDLVQPLRALLTRKVLEQKVIIVSPALSGDVNPFLQRVWRHLDLDAAISAAQASPPLHPVLPDTITPTWRHFPELAVQEASVYRRLHPLPGTPLLDFNSTSPFITYAVDSSGHIWIIAATPLGITESNNLAETGFYVPLLDRLARFGLSRATSDRHLWYAGYQYRNPFYGSAQGATIHDAENTPVAHWHNQPFVMLPMPGLYHARPKNEKPYWIAACAKPQESLLKYEDVDTIIDTHPRAFSYFPHELVSFIQSKGALSHASRLWMLFCLFGVAEALLWIRPYSQSKP
ncbi:MAG: hypothetical protein GF398_09655 [Chitinivibrionales bacterium]|nr:hypothetical protein [Chitinivibrionales bacterium]